MPTLYTIQRGCCTCTKAIKCVYVGDTMNDITYLLKGPFNCYFHRWCQMMPDQQWCQVLIKDYHNFNDHVVENLIWTFLFPQFIETLYPIPEHTVGLSFKQYISCIFVRSKLILYVSFQSRPRLTFTFLITQVRS